MPPPRRKKRASTSPIDNQESNESNAMSAIAHRSSPAPNSSDKDPLRRVHGGAVTKRFKTVTIENLNLEIAERVRKQRSLYETQARLLRQRIEMRINRIPRQFWKMTMGELLLSEAKGQAPVSRELSTLKKLVEDVRRSGRGEPVASQGNGITVKKRQVSQNLLQPATRDQMPPPLAPTSTVVNPPAGETITLDSQPVRRPLSPVKAAPAKPARQKRPATAASHRAQSRATARTSIETAATSASADVGYASTKEPKSLQARSKALSASTHNNPPSLKRGGAKGAGGSNGSLKENKVAGVKEPAATKGRARTNTTSSAGRVLRSRK
ncbi:hypothetical protein EX30DRAFT_396661 [Ascodesmis nigricans]|uniref:Borealin N-terminal domain-containing protein n=1 Tax=Ascodesmis nigricans TaxID=341454 RepID=A0A4S2MUC7_9PEZI|nr:hypothetical protein EX30DRAFT_396661 [Ascodesmis nigricans]